VLLRGLCDFVLTEESSRIEVARALASVIDAVDNVKVSSININIENIHAERDYHIIGGNLIEKY